MPRKFYNGELVRFTEYTNFGDTDIIGYVKGYFGKRLGLKHYYLSALGTETPAYFRPASHIKRLSKEEAMLFLLERQPNAKS